MKIINGYTQVYCVWVNGRDAIDEGQHFPINSNINRVWHGDFKKAVNDYENVIITEKNKDGYYKDVHVVIYSININVDKFERINGIKFDLNNEKVIELIPYYSDYKFNFVAEKLINFD